ncbi:hypothetical protein PN441_00510 [Spirulina major CS-329]|nr:MULTISPECIES: hypothetical protein [Spirulina]MDB9496794.1 hypothetical protein [Spirulina subsalsa CS-330]MDB9501535.1 hypothetical protein [Spirulina major CS-329]
MSIRPLFHRSRVRLALWYSLVMGGILSLSAYGVYLQCKKRTPATPLG